MLKSRPDAPHYCHGPMESIDIIQATLSPAQFEGYLRGTILKYLYRYPHKGQAAKDAQKLISYALWLKEVLEEQGKSVGRHYEYIISDDMDCSKTITKSFKKKIFNTYKKLTNILKRDMKRRKQSIGGGEK